MGQLHIPGAPVSAGADGFAPEDVVVLEILHAARVEIGRRLLAAWNARDAAGIERHRAHLKHTNAATCVVAKRHRQEPPK